jgi:hypothetical protein
MTKLVYCAGIVALACVVLRVEAEATDTIEKQLLHMNPVMKWITACVVDQEVMQDLSLAEEAADLSRKLDRDLASITRLARTKKRVLRDLVENRVTLLAAADQFSQLQVSWPSFNKHVLERRYPSHSETEMYCRLVLAAVQHHFPDNLEACARLDTELEQVVGARRRPEGSPVPTSLDPVAPPSR